MYGAEVGASGADDHSFYDSAVIFSAGLAPSPVSTVSLLEMTALASDVSVVAHGVPAEVNSFFQNLFHGGKHEFEVFSRNFADNREGMHSSSPKNLVGINITYARDKCLVHESCLYFCLWPFV